MVRNMSIFLINLLPFYTLKEHYSINWEFWNKIKVWYYYYFINNREHICNKTIKKCVKKENTQNEENVVANWENVVANWENVVPNWENVVPNWEKKIIKTMK